MHVQGVWEKDEIRKDDSFVTFEEIFDCAKKHEVRPLQSAIAATSHSPFSCTLMPCHALSCHAHHGYQCSNL